MHKYVIGLSVFLSINITMSSVANDFDSFFNAQLDDLSVIEETTWGNTMRAGTAAGLFALYPFSSYAANKEPPKTQQSQQQKTYSNYTESQANNIIAKTLYDEARSEGTNGINAVASVILNRAGSDSQRLPVVCLKPKQFSCWNDVIDTSPEKYNVSYPDFKNNKEKTIWEYCVNLASKLLNGKFSSTIGNRNSYHRFDVSPSWSDKMSDVKSVGEHNFGYLKDQDGKLNKNKGKSPVYTVKAGDNIGKIAKKFNTTTKNILNLNPKYKKNPDLIGIGDVIRVPG